MMAVPGFVLVAGCSGGRSRVEERPEGLPGYGLVGPCDSADPTGHHRCLETGQGELYLGMDMEREPRSDDPGERLWNQAVERLDAILRCHQAAAALDPRLDCFIAFTETAAAAGEARLALDPGTTNCPPALCDCLATAISETSSQGSAPVTGSAGCPLVLHLSVGPYEDPRSTP